MYKAWNCKERQKGVKGNGCKNRIVREEKLVEEIEKAMGKEADERTLEKVERAFVYEDHIEIILK